MLPRLAHLALVLVALTGCFVDRGDASGATSTTGDAGTGMTAEPSGSATHATDPAGGATSATDPPTTDPTTAATTSDATGGVPGGGEFCQESCQMDADCMAMMVDTGFKCVDSRCQGSSGGCADDNACRATYSGWAMTCASQAECPGGACIDIGGGAGRCATVPSDFFMCESIMQTQIMMPAIEGGMDIAVCANTDYVCKDEACQNPCEDNLACAMAPGTPQCNVGTGACECTSDDDCKNSGMAGYAQCSEGKCGCAVDADCAGAPNADVCTKDGYCGCSSAAACTTKAFDGTMSVCEGA